MFIDTQVWVFAKKEPTIDKFPDKDAFEEYKRFHQICQAFLLKSIQEEDIWLTRHQIIEIYHSLSFRGTKIPRDQTRSFLQNLENHSNVKIVSLQSTDYTNALKESEISGIHAWDYLCVLPLARKIHQIVSCDTHFQHDSLRLEGTSLVNPLGKWFLL